MNNNFNSVFSSVYRLSVFLVIVLIMGSCGSDVTDPPTPTPSSDNSLTVIYSGFGASKTLEAQGTEVILSFSNNTDNYTNAAIVLVVHKAAALSNAGVGLTLIESNAQRVFTTNHDFSGGQTYPYTVTAENGTSKNYTLKAQIKSSDSKAISSFVLSASSNSAAGVTQDISFRINGLELTASVTNVRITSLIPTITHNGKSISPASGVAQNFSTNLTYTVTAEDGSTASYRVALTPYYTVVFDANGGIYSGSTPTNYVRHGTTTNLVPASEPTREGYRFSGWSTAPGGEAYDFRTPITNAITLYARWVVIEKAKYTIILNTVGGATNLIVDHGTVFSSANVPGSACISRWFLDAGYSQVFPSSTVITSNLTLYGNSSEALGRLVAMEKLPASLEGITSSDSADQAKWRSIMAPYFPRSAGKPMTFYYVVQEMGMPSNTWTNKWALDNYLGRTWPASDMRQWFDEFLPSDPDNIKVLLVAGGNYKPTTGTDRQKSFTLKNHVAVVGGFQGDIFPNNCGDTTTVFSGDIGTPGVNTDNSEKVFTNKNINNTAVLYGVTITGGYYSIGAPSEVTFPGGAGMRNDAASPTLIKIIFSNNYVNTDSARGGGMFNIGSSPTLTEVVFANNTASYGGGMANYDSSSPILSSSPTLNRVTFTSNTAKTWGGGMNNEGNTTATLDEVSFIGNRTTEGTAGYGGGGGMNNSAGVTVRLNRVTFSGNNATGDGGGIRNISANLTAAHTTFSGNTATSEGGGLYNAGTETPVLIGVTFAGNEARHGGGMATRNSYMVNTLFWGNTATDTAVGSLPGPQIFILREGILSSGVVTNRVYYSLVQSGFDGSLTENNGNIGGGFGSQSRSRVYVYTHDGTTNAIQTGNPNLGNLANNGGWVNTHALLTGSSAVNQGVHVRRSGSTYYYSSNGTTWYSDPGLATTTVTPPADAVNLTAADARGYGRSGRPDIGAYESGGTQ